MYGAVGSIIVLLLWFYVSGLAILIGAELNAVIDKALAGDRATPEAPGQRRKIGPSAERVRQRSRRY
jgi:membrane protein